MGGTQPSQGLRQHLYLPSGAPGSAQKLFSSGDEGRLDRGVRPAQFRSLAHSICALAPNQAHSPPLGLSASIMPGPSPSAVCSCRTAGANRLHKGPFVCSYVPCPLRHGCLSCGIKLG